MDAGKVDISAPGSLERTYDLVGERSMQAQHYIVRSELATYSSKGVLKSTDVYRERLTVHPGNRSDGEADRFTCTAFTLQRGDAPEVAIPSLEGFSYEVNKDLLDANGVDAQGQLYSVPEDTFDDLVDAVAGRGAQAYLRLAVASERTQGAFRPGFAARRGTSPVDQQLRDSEQIELV